LREILDPVLRNQSATANRTATVPQKRESVVHSSLFSTEEEHKASRTDTAGWAHPGDTDSAEGGV
jgi:hypothetical protein